MTTGLVFAIVGSLIFLVSGFYWRRGTVRIRASLKLHAIVVELAEEKDSDGDTIYHPVYEFTHAGRTHRGQGGIGSKPASYSIGDAVTVLVDPDHPENHRLFDSTVRVVPMVFALAGLLLSFLGLLVLIFAQER